MFDSSTDPASVGSDIIRLIFSTFDRPAYALLGVIYELFFNVATADLFNNAMIMQFYTRVQIILGVYMMFQLAMSILKGIVNPDNFEKDSSSLISKVITALIIFVLLMPINTGGGNEFESQVNNNGLLFGTLYSLQHRILSNNTIGRLVLGTNDNEVTYGDTAVEGDTELKKSARIFTSTILKGFYRINLVPEDQRVNKNDGKDPAIYNKNRVCTDIDDSILDSYKRIDADPGEIISLVNATCNSDAKPSFLNDLRTGFERLIGSTKYIFAYTPIISTITAVVFIFILLSFTIDVAIRAVKLAVLRLIAPIPIISYMNPQAGKDSSFNAWVKALISTYLDLFIRLASVYFVIFIIQDMIVNGVGIKTTAGNGFLHVLSCIIIWIGLFIFAKQAPKFIKQVLGLKDDGGKLFSGFGEIAAAAALTSGTIGSFNASRQASKTSDIVRGKDEKSLFNRGKHLVAGIAGGVMGAKEGAAAWAGAKDHQGRAVMDAINKRNATDIQRGGSGSTFLGRIGATTARAFQGEGATTFDSKTRDIAQYKGIEKTGKDLFSYLEGKGKTDGAGYKVTTAKISGEANGVAFKDETFTGKLNDFLNAKQNAIAAQQAGKGDGTFVFSGKKFRTTDASVQKIEEELAYAAGDIWAQEQELLHKNYDPNDPNSKDGDRGYLQKKQTYNEAVLKMEGEYGTYASTDKDGNPVATNKTTSELKKMSKKAGGAALYEESKASYKKQQADYGATKK